MKRALTLLIVSTSLLAQGPVYNFNFYNGGQKAPAMQMDQNGQVKQDAAPAVAPTPAAAPVTEAPAPQPPVVKKDKRFGFEFGGGYSTTKYDLEIYNPNLDGEGSQNYLGYFNFLIPVGDKSKFKLGLSGVSNSGVQLLGFSTGFQTKGNIFSFLSITGGVQLDYMTNDNNFRTYAGAYVGPQVEIGDMFINVVAQAGYGHNKFDDIGLDAGNLEIGGRLNVGFMF